MKEAILRHIAERDDETSRKARLQVAKSDPEADLREAAIRHLAERGDTALLIELFDAEKDPDVKEAIVRHLAERDDEAARKKLLSIVRDDPSEELRAAGYPAYLVRPADNDPRALY